MVSILVSIQLLCCLASLPPGGMFHKSAPTDWVTDVREFPMCMDQGVRIMYWHELPRFDTKTGHGWYWKD